MKNALRKIEYQVRHRPYALGDIAVNGFYTTNLHFTTECVKHILTKYETYPYAQQIPYLGSGWHPGIEDEVLASKYDRWDLGHQSNSVGWLYLTFNAHILNTLLHHRAHQPHHLEQVHKNIAIK